MRKTHCCEECRHYKAVNQIRGDCLHPKVLRGEYLHTIRGTNIRYKARHSVSRYPRQTACRTRFESREVIENDH